jgi:hypothetical protein
MEFANKSAFVFDQQPASFSLNAIANDIYATPVDVAVLLGDLARLKYLNSRLSGTLLMDGAATGVVNIRLSNGAVDYHVETVTLTAETRKTFNVPAVDLSQVSGSENLMLVVDVTTASAGVNAQITARLDVEHPIVLSGC